MATAVSAPPSRIGDFFSSVLVASGVGYLAAAYAVSRFLTRRAPGRGSTPAAAGLTATPLACRTADGIDLAGWVVEPAGLARATVALFHGHRESSGQMVSRAAALSAAGFRCVAFDHRAHGSSSGQLSSFGFHEAHDVAAVAELVRAHWPESPVVAVGMSMGAAALCFAARHAKPWRAVILESLYGDIRTAFHSRLGTTYPAWFGKFEPGIIWVTERRLHLRWQQLAPLDAVGDLAPAAVLLVTGTADFSAPPAVAELLQARCRGPAELWLVPDARHKDLFEHAGPEYVRRVVGFLDRILSSTPA
jgi:uncharacterized protein